jgi:hypothetical protein
MSDLIGKILYCEMEWTLWEHMTGKGGLIHE